MEECKHLLEQISLLEKALAGLVAAVAALFGWLMKAKAAHHRDMKEALAEARARASGS